MKNTKLGSVQIYYSAYNKAAVLEKKLTIVLKTDVTDHRYDFISHSRQSDCKGVRCPPIFSLSNLINVGWL